METRTGQSVLPYILPLVAGVEARLEFNGAKCFESFFSSLPLEEAQEKLGELLGLSPGYRCPGKSTHRPGPTGQRSHNLIHFMSQHATNLWGYVFTFTKKNKTGRLSNVCHVSVP